MSVAEGAVGVQSEAAVSGSAHGGGGESEVIAFGIAVIGEQGCTASIHGGNSAAFGHRSTVVDRIGRVVDRGDRDIDGGRIAIGGIGRIAGCVIE